ncbi:MAG TPA: S-adenosylmethionine decarboxylase [Methanoculleus sp.]|nr:S-adenosylmethionine decarboxylase [Methanoculleus sp.]
MCEAVTDASVIEHFKTGGAWGLYTCVDLKGCNPETIRNADRIREFIIELCDLIDMKRFGEPQIVHFGPNDRVAGYSMTQLIETSLISGHFANESNAAYLDIFSCKEYAPTVMAEFCKEFFEAVSMTYQVIMRE